MSSYTRLPAERQWQIVLHRISTLPLPANQAVVLEYLSERRASGGIDPSTLTADADEFKRFGAWAGERPFKELQKPDIVQFFGSITHKNPRTRHKTYLILRAFYRWLGGLDPDETPPQFKGFRMKRPPRKEIKPEELITPDELQAMLRLCRTTQERCLVMRQAYARALPLLESLSSVSLTAPGSWKPNQVVGAPAAIPGPSHVRQRVVTLEELDALFEQGWLYRASLKGGKVVVEKAD